MLGHIGLENLGVENIGSENIGIENIGIENIGVDKEFVQKCVSTCIGQLMCTIADTSLVTYVCFQAH